MIIVDGNDGTGKSTLVSALKALGYEVQDRGIATRKTDDPTLIPEKDAFYVILDAPVEVSRARLAEAGKDLSEKYHTWEDLSLYRKRFLEIAAELPAVVVIESTGSPEETLAKTLAALGRVGIKPNK